MWTNRRGLIAGGAVLAVLAIALIAVNAGEDQGGDDPASVLGVQFNSTTSTTTTTTAPGEPTTPTTAPGETTTTTAAPAPTTTAAPATTASPPRTIPTTTTAPPSPRAERVVEPSDNRGTFTYRPGEPPTAGATPPNHPAGDRFRFLVYIDPPDAEDGVATVRVEMHNDSGRPIVFPEGGLLIRVFLTRDDGQERTVEIRRTEIGGLAPRESLELFQEYITEPGTYQFRAEAPVEYR